jgi:hypothetical protein
VVELRQRGLLIEPNDSRDLMRALQKIHDMGPDGRRAMGEAARRNVLRDFNANEHERPRVGERVAAEGKAGREALGVPHRREG